jgi:hypothetical protein
MGTPTYRGHPYHQFRFGCYKVYVDIPAHPFDPTMMTLFTMARGDDLDDTLERVVHQALTEFCEHHLPIIDGTAITLLSV